MGCRLPADGTRGPAGSRQLGAQARHSRASRNAEGAANAGNPEGASAEATALSGFALPIEPCGPTGCLFRTEAQSRRGPSGIDTGPSDPVPDSPRGATTLPFGRGALPDRAALSSRSPPNRFPSSATSPLYARTLSVVKPNRCCVFAPLRIVSRPDSRDPPLPPTGCPEVVRG